MLARRSSPDWPPLQRTRLFTHARLATWHSPAQIHCRRSLAMLQPHADGDRWRRQPRQLGAGELSSFVRPKRKVTVSPHRLKHRANTNQTGRWQNGREKSTTMPSNKVREAVARPGRQELIELAPSQTKANGPRRFHRRSSTSKPSKSERYPTHPSSSAALSCSTSVASNPRCCRLSHRLRRCRGIWRKSSSTRRRKSSKERSEVLQATTTRSCQCPTTSYSTI